MIKKIILILAGCVCLFMMTLVFADSVVGDAAAHMTRLHILANSDSKEDQAVKLLVRDRILESFGGKTPDANPDTLLLLQQTAAQVLSENGFSYGAQAFLGTFDFPQKQYENMTLPAGRYYGLKLILGEGDGQNWWCVMNPPLCLTKSAVGELPKTGEAQLQASLEGETYRIITEENTVYHYKLKIVEWIRELAD